MILTYKNKNEKNKFNKIINLDLLARPPPALLNGTF